MKENENLIQLANDLSLPKDVIFNQTIIHFVVPFGLLIENYKRVKYYSSQQIIIQGSRRNICICGEQLKIDVFFCDEIKISGNIHTVSFDA